MSETKNIIEGLFDEMNRVREIIKEYEALSFEGKWAADVMKFVIHKGERSIIDGDVIEMIEAYHDLKGFHL